MALLENGGAPGGPQQQMRVTINPAELPSVECEACNNDTFQQGVFLKKLSALHPAAQGEEKVVPIPTFVCLKCGHVNEEFSIRGITLGQ